MSNKLEMTTEQAWELFEKLQDNNWEPVEGLDEMTYEISNLLSKSPKIEEVKTNEQGINIEFSDCYHFLMVRVPSITSEWKCYCTINTWDYRSTQQNSFVSFINSDTNEEFILVMETLIIYKKI